jgi:hypothetical protein
VAAKYGEERAAALWERLKRTGHFVEADFTDPKGVAAALPVGTFDIVYSTLGYDFEDLETLTTGKDNGEFDPRARLMLKLATANVLLRMDGEYRVSPVGASHRLLLKQIATRLGFEMENTFGAAPALAGRLNVALANGSEEYLSRLHQTVDRAFGRYPDWLEHVDRVWSIEPFRNSSFVVLYKVKDLELSKLPSE